MTPEEVAAAKLLRGVKFPTATFDKKAAATVEKLLSATPAKIGEKMVPQLWHLVQRYRRQIHHPERTQYVRMAELLSTTNVRARKNGAKILARRAKDRVNYAQKRQAKKANQEPQPTATP